MSTHYPRHAKSVDGGDLKWLFPCLAAGPFSGAGAVAGLGDESNPLELTAWQFSPPPGKSIASITFTVRARVSDEEGEHVDDEDISVQIRYGQSGRFRSLFDAPFGDGGAFVTRQRTIPGDHGDAPTVAELASDVVQIKWESGEDYTVELDGMAIDVEWA